MASLLIKPLDGDAGYLRWKESILLRLCSLHIVHVLFGEPPLNHNSSEAARGANEDALCRGHILHTLSDHLFVIFSHHSTSKELWIGLEKTYLMDNPDKTVFWRVSGFMFDESKPILEELARFDSVAATSLKDQKNDDMYCKLFIPKLPVSPLQASFLEISKSRDWIWLSLRSTQENKRDAVEKNKLRREGEPSFICGQEGNFARNCQVSTYQN